jgi:hypothetical protein
MNERDNSMTVTKFYKGNRYFYAHEAKQVSFVRWDQSGLVVVVDDNGEQYHIHAHELSELPPQYQGNIEDEEVS